MEKPQEAAFSVCQSLGVPQVLDRLMLPGQEMQTMESDSRPESLAGKRRLNGPRWGQKEGANAVRMFTSIGVVPEDRHGQF